LKTFLEDLGIGLRGYLVSFINCFLLIVLMEEKFLIEKTGGVKKHYSKYWVIGFFAFALGFFTIYALLNFTGEIEQELICGDGTPFNSCSLNEPYYCKDNVLIENIEECGCPKVLRNLGNACFSSNYVEEKDISLKYIFEKEKKFIDLPIYEGVINYLNTLPRSLITINGENYSRRDFKLMKIDNELQREALMPLVIKIQNLAPWSKDLQAQIAISLVQNIPYGEPDYVDVFGGRFEVRLSRYPYQTLEEHFGSCECKSELLVFLLRELGFEVGLFYYQEENHEAVGIKCPEKYSLNNTGYCFVETTLPAPISYDRGRYQGPKGSAVLGNYTEFLFISEGISLSDNLNDYSDANVLGKLVDKVDEKGYLNYFEKKRFDNLREKYGLIY